MKIIRKKDGHINEKSTLKAFQVELGKRVKEEETIRNDKKLKDAVESVIAETTGFDISPAFLESSTVHKLFQAGDNYDDMVKRVKLHIRLNKYLKK